jgi:hypothetical protein
MIFGEVGETIELFIVVGVMFLGIYIVYLIQKQTMR